MLFHKEKTKVNGIDIDLRSGVHGKQLLVFTLQKQVDRDLFEGFCRTLISTINNATDSVSSLAVALAHVRRWKSFLSGKKQLLSPEEIRGLFTELDFLVKLIQKMDTSSAAVEAWLGPERSHQDFIFGNTAVEIKSISGADRSSVRISSEDQLESVNDFLYLKIYRLSDQNNIIGALSLNEKILLARENLNEHEAIELFDQRLSAYGYAPLQEYDKPKFFINETSTYLVNKKFPRLIRSQIATGVNKVTYDLELESLESFKCDHLDVFKEI